MEEARALGMLRQQEARAKARAAAEADLLQARMSASHSLPRSSSAPARRPRVTPTPHSFGRQYERTPTLRDWAHGEISQLLTRASRLRESFDGDELRSIASELKAAASAIEESSDRSLVSYAVGTHHAYESHRHETPPRAIATHRNRSPPSSPRTPCEPPPSAAEAAGPRGSWSPVRARCSFGASSTSSSSPTAPRRAGTRAVTPPPRLRTRTPPRRHSPRAVAIDDERSPEHPPWVASACRDDGLFEAPPFLFPGSFHPGPQLKRGAPNFSRSHNVEHWRRLLAADVLLDGPLRERLQDGSIRLLRCAWLMDPASDAALGRDPTTGAPVIRRMQSLPAAAFVSAHQAMRLLSRRDRSILALSHAWLKRSHPDPHGHTLAAVRRYLATDVRASRCALFWDFASLPQPDRLKDERAVYARARQAVCYPRLGLRMRSHAWASYVCARGLHVRCMCAACTLRSCVYTAQLRVHCAAACAVRCVCAACASHLCSVRALPCGQMGSLYGSMTATAVLRCRDVLIPPGVPPALLPLYRRRPDEIRPGRRSPARPASPVRSPSPPTLVWRTGVAACGSGFDAPRAPGDQARAHAPRAAAAAAAEEEAEAEAEPLPPLVPYEERGWARFEQAAATIPAVAIEESRGTVALPERLALALATRPKMIDISGGGLQPLSAAAMAKSAPTWVRGARAELARASYSEMGDRAKLLALIDDFELRSACTRWLEPDRAQ